MKKSIRFLFLLILCGALIFTSCMSRQEVTEPVEPGQTTEPVSPEVTEPVITEPVVEPEVAPSTLTKTESRMLWRIDGKDRNGEDSIVYILGTFHFADNSVYPFSDEILGAWKSADRLAAEISSDDQVRLSNEVLPAMLAESQKAAVGRQALDELSDDCRMFFYNSFTPEQRDLFNSFEPWYTGLSCSSGLVMAMGLDPNSGLDNILTAMAMEEGRSIEGLDALETQTDILRFGSWEEQLVITEQSVRELINIQKSAENLVSLYTAYVNDDPETIQILVDEEIELDLPEKDAEILDRYTKAVYEDRNDDWAEKIHEYILDGGTTFIFAGSAHFCSENSVFNKMREKNYLK
ncbi:MAG: TraB/GumN family protein [Treponemataceae bacterium]|nr:TraB/GumN family protein [Treponemataceae bacterium]